MADLAAVATADVALVEVIEQDTAPAAVVIVAGQLLGYDANGHWVLADADAVVVARAIALNDATVIGITVTGLKKGLINIGAPMAALAFSANIFPSATAGRLADAVVNAQPAIGYVAPGHEATTAAQLLRVDM